MDEGLAARTARALSGNLHTHADKLAGQGKLFVRDRLELLLDTDSFVEDALLANAAADDLPADGVVTGVGLGRGPPGVRGGQRSHREGGVVGRSHRREDRAGHRARPAPRAPDVLAGRLGWCPHHGPGRAVPRPPGGGTDLLQPGAVVRPGAADLLPVRSERGGRGLHPVLLRHRDHGGGERLHVPRLAPHGGDGHRGADHARGDGRRADARHRVGLRRQPRRRRRRRHRAGQGRARLPPADVAGGAAGLRGDTSGANAERRDGARRSTPRATTCTP